MAIVLVEVNRKAQQQRGCNCNQQQRQQNSATDTASAQRVMQQAAAMPAATPNPGTVEAETIKPKSYLTAFLLMAVFGGVYLVSQYKGK